MRNAAGTAGIPGRSRVHRGKDLGAGAILAGFRALPGAAGKL